LVRDIAAELGAARGGTPHFPETVVADEQSAQLVRAAHLAAEHGDPLAASSSLHAALAGLLSRHARPAGREPAGRVRRAARAVRAARELLHERVTAPPALDELARLTGLGPHALLRAFRAETGLPPHQYLNQVRVRMARRPPPPCGRWASAEPLLAHGSSGTAEPLAAVYGRRPAAGVNLGATSHFGPLLSTAPNPESAAASIMAVPR